MCRMPREPEAFGEQVARILQRQFPERKVELAGPMDLVLAGKHLGLDNLYRMVLCEPDRGGEIVEKSTWTSRRSPTCRSSTTR
jgi:hypothetical protein